MPITGLLDFRANAAKFTGEVIPDAVAEVHREAHLLMVEKLTLYTPIRTGTARSGYISTLTRPSNRLPRQRTRIIGNPDVTAESQPHLVEQNVQRAAAVLKNLKPFSASYISNSVVYLPFLNNGSSKQAGAAFIERAVNDARLSLREGASLQGRLRAFGRNASGRFTSTRG